jgi:hypothetical protein
VALVTITTLCGLKNKKLNEIEVKVAVKERRG